MKNFDTIILILILIFTIFTILFTHTLQMKKMSREKFENTEKITTTTNIMAHVPDVPTIKLIEAPPNKTIIQKIMSPTNQRVSFKINTVNSDYVVNVPNYLDYNFAGKGLVIAASGNRYRYITGLYSNLYTIRKYHKSNIPIEIFYVGKSEEFSNSIKKLLLDLGNIKIINLMDRIDTNSSEEDLRGYQTKPLSVLCSSFKEIYSKCRSIFS